MKLNELLHPAASEGGKSMSDGPQVLVVDDELQIRRFLRISLERDRRPLAAAVDWVSVAPQ